METFYITYDRFWTWFDQADDEKMTISSSSFGLKTKYREQDDYSSRETGKTQNSPSSVNKRIKTDRKPVYMSDTEAATRADSRYIILHGRHKPGKKTKVWEADGYLSLVRQVAHICDLNGRLLEEPTLLEEMDLRIIHDMGELTIGNTDIQIVEKESS